MRWRAVNVVALEGAAFGVTSNSTNPGYAFIG
jgi:hypothetical protein